MDAVFNKYLLSWYLLNLKIRETIKSGIQKLSTEQEPLRSFLSNLVLKEAIESRIQRSSTEQEAVQQQEATPTETVEVVIKEDNGNGKDLEAGKSPAAEWIISMTEKLDQAHQDDAEGSWGNISIYRIPNYLREDNKAYVPQTVSIGPYHHGKKHIRQMDRHKWRSLYHVLKRRRQDKKVYLDAMKVMEERVRSCYEGSIDHLSSNKFVEMLVLDGCFVLELFQGAAHGFKQLGYDRNDPVFAMRGCIHSIQRDMIMLENQLPLFVLDRLLEIQLGQKGQVEQLVLRFFDPSMPVMPGSFPLINFNPLNGPETVLHCLDVLRRSLLFGAPKIWMKKQSHVHPIADKRRVQLIHCVTELKEAGIKFKKRKSDRFWDIEFKNGVLWIPRLLIHDGTKSLFLNLVAFEQCHVGCKNHMITSYVIFMDNLINSLEDVAYLHYCGIIEPMLRHDDEVADLFNRICQEVVFDNHNSYLSKLYEDVNRYYNQRWNTWRATLKHRYFNNPWAIISLVAAVLLLLLTFGQAFYGVYASRYSLLQISKPVTPHSNHLAATVF